MLSAGKASARPDVLINIERTMPTTAPGANPPHCDGAPQYAVISGAHKLLIGGGGLPNT